MLSQLLWKNSVRALANIVAGRVIVADPDFDPPAPRHRATDRNGIAPDDLRIVSAIPFRSVGIAPDDLRIVSASPVTAVRPIVVIRRFGAPSPDHFMGTCRGAPDLEQVLAVGRLRPMGELLPRQQGVGPILGKFRQAVRPAERRQPYPRADGIVREQHFFGGECPLRGGGGKNAEEQEQERHASLSVKWLSNVRASLGCTRRSLMPQALTFRKSGGILLL